MKKLFWFFLLIIPIFSSYSQYPPCNLNYPGLSFQADHLASFPPYSMYMPYDVLVSYIALDTLSKHGFYPDMKDFLDRQSYNDTIQTIYKLFYKVVDYDPIKLFLTMKDNSFIATTPQGLIRDLIIETIPRLSPNPNLDKALLKSFIIAKIYINNIIAIEDSNALNLGKNVQICTAEILDTIKGLTIPICKDTTTPNKFIKYQNQKQYGPAYPGGCLQFNYCLDWNRGNDAHHTLRDSLGNPWIKLNKEYIVFLNFTIECEDSSGVYYCVRPSWPESFTFLMFPVENGFVYDPKNEFGFGLNLTANEFISKLRSRINEIRYFIP